jgi:cytochrome P450
VAPILALATTEETTVGDVRVPKGVDVSLLLRPPAIARAHFDDPERFDPARWLGPTEGRAHVPAASRPFGGGPRICPGRSLALLEMRVALATLLGSFDLERVGPAGAVREKFSFVMQPEGLRVRLRPRTRSATVAA